jgi:hypothetical protein
MDTTGLCVREQIDALKVKGKLLLAGALRLVVGLVLPMAGFAAVVYVVLKALGPSVKGFPLWLYLHHVFAEFFAWAAITTFAIALGLKVMSWGIKQGARLASAVEKRLGVRKYSGKEMR